MKKQQVVGASRPDKCTSMKSSSRVLLPRDPTPPRFCTRNFTERSSLDVSHAGNCDDHLIVGIKILCIEIACYVVDFCASFIAIFVLNSISSSFITLRQMESSLSMLSRISNGLFQFIIFIAQFILLKACKLTQTHFNYGSCLCVRQAETFRKRRSGYFRGR